MFQRYVSAPEFDGILRSRRSVRAYKPEPLDSELLREALDAARWAPSPHNAQPWRFVVLTTVQSKLNLAEAMGQPFRRDLLADGLSPDEVAARTEQSRNRLAGAAAVVVVCLSEEGLQRYPDADRQAAERAMAVQSLGAAIQNLLLTLHHRGWGACWMCAPLFCPETVRLALDLPDGWEPQAMITVGRPAEEPIAPGRRGLESIVVYR
jgi:F420 biosynthesis protein FbiB-like protein